MRDYDYEYDSRRTHRSRSRRTSSGGCLGKLFKVVIFVLAAVAVVHFLMPLSLGTSSEDNSGQSESSSENSDQSEAVLDWLTDGLKEILGGILSGDGNGGSSLTDDGSNGDNASGNQNSNGDGVAESVDSSAAAYAGTAACYYYSTLSEDEKKVYCQIYQGLAAEEESFEVSMHYDELQEMMDMVSADHPEIFWYEGSYISRTRLLGGATVEPDYNCSGEEREKKAQEIKTAGEKILAEVPSASEDPWLTAKAVYDYLITNISYNENASDNQNLYSSLVNHETVCAGYARAAEYLLQQAGIESVYLCGTMTTGESHAWNALKLNGSWYLLDATCGRSAVETEVGQQVRDPAYAYLCCTDAELYRGRSAELSDRNPVCDSTDLEYYKKKEQRFDSCVEKDIRWNIYYALSDGDGWSVQFTNEEAYQQCLSLLEDGMMTDVIRKNSLRSGNLLCQTQYDDTLYTVTCLVTKQ